MCVCLYCTWLSINFLISNKFYWLTINFNVAKICFLSCYLLGEIWVFPAFVLLLLYSTRRATSIIFQAKGYGWLFNVCIIFLNVRCFKCCQIHAFLFLGPKKCTFYLREGIGMYWKKLFKNIPSILLFGSSVKRDEMVRGNDHSIPY